jgi:rubrerythrin
VQALGSLGEHRAVLLAFKTNEGQARDKYRRHAGRAHPPEVREVVRRAADDEEKHYRWAAETLERLGAGPDTLTGLAQQAAEAVHGRAADVVESVERRAMQAAERLRRGG